MKRSRSVLAVLGYAFEKQLASEQAMTANEMAMSWDWGPWGGWPYG